MPTMLESFNTALEGNPHITAIDGATVEAGRKIAGAIDKITADTTATPTEVTKALYLTPHLISILKELLATPLARKQVGLATAEKKTASRLTRIQEAAKKVS